MKIDRLIGILSILLQQEKVTAPYLAEHFEVSRRTINRDIDDLCKAGIPIVTRQGVNGGISIMEGYKIDRTLLTSADLQAIFAGLRSLDSVSGTNRYGQLMEKLSVGASNVIAADQHILIDLSSWYKGSLSPKIEIIHAGIEQQELLTFNYFSKKGESRREIEPYHLVFQWSSWYVWGWCRKRQDFRLFKLNRMTDLHCTGEKFEKREVPLPDLSIERVFPHKLKIKAVFAPECKWRLIEEYGKDCYVEQPDGNLLLQVGYTDRENLLSWILGFGDKAELLEPVELREELGRIGGIIQKKYSTEKDRMKKNNIEKKK